MKTFCLLLFTLFIFNQGLAQVTGPNAPDVNIFYVSAPVPGFSFDINNPSTSNNYNESYLEFDPTINPTATDLYWRFEGYMVFQLLNDTIDFNETFNTSYSQLAAVVDIPNAYGSVNLILDGCNETTISLTDSGLSSGIFIENDAFTGLPFIENENYCFRVLAFAKNPYAQDATCGIFDYALIGNTTGIGTSILANCSLASESVGLMEKALESTDIYPNPTNESIFIETYLNGEPVKVTVFDELGYIVLERNSTKDKIELELPDAGVYIVRIENDMSYIYQKVIRL